MKWTRTSVGYLSADRRYFIERGGEWEGARGGVDPTRHMWLIWQLADPATYVRDEFGAYGRDDTSEGPLRTLTQLTCGDVTGNDYYRHVEDCGWLADAKASCPDDPAVPDPHAVTAYKRVLEAALADHQW